MLIWEDGNTRHTILKVALELFAERGYRGVSTRQICDAAGVTQPTLYYHFGNKEGLCASLLQLVTDHAEEDIRRVFDNELPILDKLRDYARTRFAFVETHTHFVKFLLEFLLGPDSVGIRDEHMKRVGQLHAHLREALKKGQQEGIIRRSIDIEVATMALTGSINTIIVMNLHLQGHELDDSLADAVADLWLGGLQER
jgi:AcrR family transcriptional regulator